MRNCVGDQGSKGTMSTVARARELRCNERPRVCTAAIQRRIAVLLRSTLDQTSQSYVQYSSQQQLRR